MSHLLLSPLTWGVLLALLLFLLWPRLLRPLRVVGLLLLAVPLGLCTPLGANALVQWVESGHELEACPQSREAGPLVVLSGGFQRPPHSLADYPALHPESWRRLHSAVSSWQHEKGVLVISGGGPHEIAESDVLAGLARTWGVPQDDLRIETESTTTWGNAFELKGRVVPRIRLVTSALHMPRALVAFRAAGFEPCGQVSDSHFVPFDGGWGYFVPQSSALVKSERALHELAGLWAYRWRAGREAD